jgi:hypothetical protein
MKKIISNISTVLIFLLVSMLWGCSSQTLEPDENRFGGNYFPLEKGQYTIYNVESQSYNSNKTIDIDAFQLKEVVEDTFTTLTNQKAFRLNRYRRADETQSWEIDSVWYVEKTFTQVLKTENNIKYLKLIFPFDAKSRWNGNLYNDLGNRSFQIFDYKKPRQYDTINALNTIRILHYNDSSLVTQVKREEIYAPNIGLIEQKRINVRYRSDAVNLGKGVIEFGIIYKETLIGYGKE